MIWRGHAASFLLQWAEFSHWLHSLWQSVNGGENPMLQAVWSMKERFLVKGEDGRGVSPGNNLYGSSAWRPEPINHCSPECSEPGRGQAPPFPTCRWCFVTVAVQGGGMKAKRNFVPLELPLVSSGKLFGLNSTTLSDPWGHLWWRQC